MVDSLPKSFVVRDCISLRAFSALARIIRYSGYSSDFPPTQESFWVLHRDVQEALRNDRPEWIYNDCLEIEMGGKTHQVTVDMRNTQFIGADLEISHFRDGYEPDILFCVDHFVPDDGVYIDIGANWGYFPVYLTARDGFTGQIVAVEPAPRSSRDLAHVVDVLDIRHKVKVHSVAVSDHAGKVNISDELWTGNNSIVSSGLDETVNGSEVECQTLDHLLQSDGLSRVDLIKMDVEGAEDAVLRGAEQTIRQFTPVIIFENWISASEEKTLAPFRELEKLSLGYQFFVIEMQETERFSFSYELKKVDPSVRSSYGERLNVIAMRAK